MALRLPSGLFALLVAAALVAPPCAAQYFAFGKNRVQYEALDWHYLQSTHFDVYFYEREATAPSGRALASFAARAAEDALVQVQDLFGYELTDRVPLLVYQSHNDFAVTNAADLPVYAEGIGGVTELFKNRVAVPFTGDWREFRRVLHHELVHAVLNDMFYGGSIQSILQNDLRLQIPDWFNEGLAEYAALGWDTQSDLYLRNAVLDDYLDPIPRLHGYYAYRGGQGVWDFIAHEYGREKIAEVLMVLRLSRSVEAAFRETTGLSLRDLSERWHDALRTVYFPEVAAREALDVIARPMLPEQEGRAYHASPALSPLGDQVAYVATDDGLFDVYVMPTSGTGGPRKLVDGQSDPRFETIRVLTPGLAWSPDGQRLAVAVKSGPGDAIALVEVPSGRTRHVRVPNVDAILSVAWSPDGTHLAFEGTAGAQADLYVLDLATGGTVNVTGDVFGDHAPAWSPDGNSLVFHSDRGANLLTNRLTIAGGADPRAHDLTQTDLYRLRLDDRGHVERLTSTPDADERDAFFAGDSAVVFVSDRNGVPNLYAQTLATRAERPLTDLQGGVLQLAVSADGQKAVVTALEEGSPALYLLRHPLGRRHVEAPLAPTVWAQRRGASGEAPALRLASAATRQRNPLLRAADTPPFAADPTALDSLFAVDLFSDTLTFDSLDVLPAEYAGGTNGHRPYFASSAEHVDFRRYEFSDAFDEAARVAHGDGEPDRFAVTDNTNPDGSFRTRRYRLRFTPDLVYAAGSYDTVFGVQSVTQMLFSDVLGNHRIALATNLVFDLRNADYLFGYQHLAGRTDYAVQAFHLARELPDQNDQTVFRYRNYGFVGEVSYPLDKFRRVDVALSALGVSLTDLGNLGDRPRARRFLLPQVTYTRDGTTPGFLSPAEGTRYAASLSASPGIGAAFATALADARHYRRIWPATTLALRASAGASVGPDPQRFYAAGVQNWINPESRSLVVEDPDDFLFATPVLPLRGFGFNEAAGDRFALVNAEVRAPLAAALLPGPLPILPLYHLQVVAFADAALIAEGAFQLWRTNETGVRVFDDAFVGAGLGLRTILLGYPLRVDWAWPYDGREWGEVRTLVSIGLDF